MAVTMVDDPRLGRWAGAWVDLLDDLDGARTLVVDAGPGRASVELVERGAVVTFVDEEAGRAAGRRAVLRGAVDRARICSAIEAVAAGPFDLLVFDAVLPSASVLRGLLGSLRPGGRVVLVVDNSRSILRAVDRTRRRPAGAAAAAGSGALRRLLADAGLEPRQVFGLLRSSVAPVTAFDLGARRAAVEVLWAAGTRVHDHRAGALELLRRLAERGRAGDVVPAWLVVASPDGGWEPPPDRVTGRLGYDDSDEPKLVRGEPPAMLDRWYASAEAAEAEAMAYATLEAAGLDVAPRFIAHPTPRLVRQSWLDGRPLRPGALAPADAERWLWRAVDVLASVHQATARADGSVLVHGDYWLGNLLVDGDRVVGVVDWTKAHWGGAAEDAEHLLVTAGEWGLIEGDRLARLRGEVARNLGVTGSSD